MTCNPEHLDRNETVAQTHPARCLVSLELSRKAWLVTSLASESEKMAKHHLTSSAGVGLLELLARLKDKAEQRLGRPVDLVVIQEAGLDGFWIHRLLESKGITSYVVEAASIAVPRRYRRAKTDRIDGETLIRTLAAWLRGEPRVCSMVRPRAPRRRTGAG